MFGMETRYVGGLLVAEEGRTERQVQRELERIEVGLFLDKEIDLNTGRLFFSVKYHAGSERPPDLILDWREPDDTPKPLTFGLVDEVKRMRQQGPVTRQELERLNRDAQERRRKTIDADYAEITSDFERKDSVAHSALLKRGVGLRMSRDKQRSAGRKV